MTISAGIGFVFLGNIYDNVEKPRQVTAVILLILSLISLVEAIFAVSLVNDQSSTTTDQVVMTLYQMSSVFEAGISLACIVIIHNWFKETILGIVCAGWLSALYLQAIIQSAIYQRQSTLSGSPFLPFDINNKDRNQLTTDTLMIESYILFACYLVLAVICWFFFYHHPSHIGIQIRRKQDNSNNYAFNVDNTPVGWNRPNRAGSDEDNNQVDQQNL